MSVSESRASFFDDVAAERARTVLQQAFVAGQLGMPSEDLETAVESLWIILEALTVDHLAPDDRLDPTRTGRRVALSEHWKRMVTTAVTNTFVLSGGFVMPDEMFAAVEKRAQHLANGELWHTRRPPAQGALVFGVHSALITFDQSVASHLAVANESDALVDVIALSTLGAVLAWDLDLTRRVNEIDNALEDELFAESFVDAAPERIASSFGIPDVHLLPVARSGWVCDECGCFFAGRIERGIAYPDRFAPIGKSGPCDNGLSCICHQAPLQRRIR